MKNNQQTPEKKTIGPGLFLLALRCEFFLPPSLSSSKDLVDVAGNPQ